MDEATPRIFSDDKEALRQKAVAAKEAVADLAGEAGHYAAARARDAKESAAEWAQIAKAKAAGMGEQTAAYIQRNPYSAIAVAAGVGFLAGLLLKRR